MDESERAQDRCIQRDFQQEFDYISFDLQTAKAKHEQFKAGQKMHPCLYSSFRVHL